MAIVVNLSLLATTPCKSLAERQSSAIAPIHIQTVDWRNQERGTVRCNLTNFGLIGSTPGLPTPYATKPSAMWPGFSGVEYLWSAGLWIGALKNGIPAVSTASYNVEFRPGRNFNDIMYETQENATGGHRLPSIYADDDGDNKIDEDPLDGSDNDGDQKVDEDFAAISDQMLTARYNDTDPDILNFHPDHQPLGLEILQNSMSWLNDPNQNFIGFDYKIINAGADTLVAPYVGIFADFDIGRRSDPVSEVDDRAGFWEGVVQSTGPGAVQDVPVSVGYMLDDDGDGGDADGVIGIVFLNIEDRQIPSSGAIKLRNYRTFSGAVPYEFGGDPRNDQERYEVLKGSAPYSLAPPNPSTNRTPSSTPPGNFRNVVSVGPFSTLAPGDTICISMAMVIGHGFAGMLQTAARAQILYNGLWFDCDKDPQTGIDGKECNARWMSDVPTPVELQQFSATPGGPGVRLQCQFARSALDDVRALSLQRSTNLAGPYEDRQVDILPSERMTFEDDDIDTGKTYWYRLVLTLNDGSREPTRSVSVLGSDSAFSRPDLFVGMPTASSPVELRYRIAKGPSPVVLSIYDIRGHLVRNIDALLRSPGEYLRSWDRRDQNGAVVAPGIYLVNLRTGGESLSRKVVLLR